MMQEDKDMVELRAAGTNEVQTATTIIDAAKRHLKEQGIDQWQTGYPDDACIKRDLEAGKGFFVVENGAILGYLCVDYDGEPAYDQMQGTWNTSENYVVVHRMAFAASARGKGISSSVFQLVEKMSKQRGITSFRVDTDEDNHKMRHILQRTVFHTAGRFGSTTAKKSHLTKCFDTCLQNGRTARGMLVSA